jgi:hypothetical protein
VRSAAAIKNNSKFDFLEGSAADVPVSDAVAAATTTAASTSAANAADEVGDDER